MYPSLWNSTPGSAIQYTSQSNFILSVFISHNLYLTTDVWQYSLHILIKVSFHHVFHYKSFYFGHFSPNSFFPVDKMTLCTHVGTGSQYLKMAFGLQPLLKSPVSNLWRFWHSNCGFLSKIWKEIEWPNQILPGWTQFCVIFNCWSCGKKSWSTIKNYTKVGPSWQNLVWLFNFFLSFA